MSKEMDNETGERNHLRGWKSRTLVDLRECESGCEFLYFAHFAHFLLERPPQMTLKEKLVKARFNSVQVSLGV